MLKMQSPFIRDRELMLVEAMLTGPRQVERRQFLLDTGASTTAITPEFADVLGYSVRDGIEPTRVKTVAGFVAGYRLHLQRMSVMGVAVERFPVHVLDLNSDRVGGLVGMNFLKRFNFEVRSRELKILLEALPQ